MRNEKKVSVGEINIDNKKITVLPLMNVMLNEVTNNILVYGDYFDAHLFENIYLEVYSIEGRSLMSKTLIGHYPLQIITTEMGNIIYSANEEKTYDPFIAKMDKNGNQLWKRKLGDDFVYFISASISEKYIAIAGSKRNEFKSFLYILNDKGEQYNFEKGSPKAVQFIEDKKVIVITENNWHLLDVDKKFEIVKEGNMAGKVLNNHAVVYFEEKNIVIILCKITNSSGALFAQIINTETGESFAEEIKSVNEEFGLLKTTSLSSNIKKIYSDNFSITIEVKSVVSD